MWVLCVLAVLTLKLRRSDVGRAEPCRNKTVQRLADGFGSAAAEHVLRGGVEQDDALPGIDSDDCVHCRVDNGLEPGLVAGEARRASRDHEPDQGVEPTDRYIPRRRAQQS